MFNAAGDMPETHTNLVNLVREFPRHFDVHPKYGGEIIDWTIAPNFKPELARHS